MLLIACASKGGPPTQSSGARDGLSDRGGVRPSEIIFDWTISQVEFACYSKRAAPSRGDSSSRRHRPTAVRAGDRPDAAPGRRRGRRCRHCRRAAASWQRNGHGARQAVRRTAPSGRGRGQRQRLLCAKPQVKSVAGRRREPALPLGRAAASSRRADARFDARAVHAQVNQQRPRFTQRSHQVVMAAGSEDEILETAVLGRPERSCRLHSPAQHGGRIDRRGTELDQYPAAFPFGHARVSRSGEIEQTQNHVTHRHAPKSSRCTECAIWGTVRILQPF